MSGPLGYAAPPGYDDDEDVHNSAPVQYPGSGQHQRLLQEMEEPMYRA